MQAEDATTYAIVVRSSDPENAWITYKSAYGYDGGQALYLDGTWKTTTQDHNFMIYGVVDGEGTLFESWTTGTGQKAYSYESAQTFLTTSAHPIDSIALRCARFSKSYPDDTLEVEIQATTDGEPNGDVLASTTIDYNDLPVSFAWLTITFDVGEITTQAVSGITYDYALGNGTIVTGTNITERGFEVRLDYGAYKDSQDGSLGGYVFHSVAGFDGTVTWDLVWEWNGILTKTITEENGFEAGAYTGDLAKQPYPMFYDTLFKCESYTYRAYMVAAGTTYYGDYVAFDTLCDAGEEQQPTDDISEGNPIEPIIPIEPIVLIEEEFPEFIWELPEPEFPPWIFPDLPPWEFPDYPPMDWTGDFYYRRPYTKKDLDDLRKKCIIYSKNSIEFALVLRHNMNVLREFFNMMTDYMEKEEFNDFTDLIPPQRLKELYLDPLGLNDFRDMINGFIRNTIDNNIAVNRNFKLIQDGLSDYETESDDAYFKEINSNIKTVTENDPDVHRLKRKIDSLNREVSMNFSNIMYNLKVLRARLL